MCQGCTSRSRVHAEETEKVTSASARFVEALEETNLGGHPLLAFLSDHELLLASGACVFRTCPAQAASHLLLGQQTAASAAPLSSSASLFDSTVATLGTCSLRQLLRLLAGLTQAVRRASGALLRSDGFGRTSQRRGADRLVDLCSWLGE